MALELDGSYAKLDWAERHCDALQGKITSWTREKPNTVSSEFYPEADVVAGRLVVSIPPLWGVMTGNIIHNARSALDYMVCQLVRKEGNTPKDGPGGNQFPIFDYRPKEGFTKRVRHSMLAGVSDSDRAAIKDLQPYLTRDDPNIPRNPLSDLGALSNVDKHQRLVGFALNPLAGHPVQGRLRFFGVQDVPAYHFAPLTALKDGAVFAWAEVVPDGSMEPKMYMDAELTLQVRLDDGQDLGVTLGTILSSTRMILDAFAAGTPENLRLRRVDPPTLILS